MIQPIAGVAPAATREATVMTVWPTIAATRFGQKIGRLCTLRAGVGPILTVGNFLALLLIGPSIALFVASLLPGAAQRYLLTNRRVVIQRRTPKWRSIWENIAEAPLGGFDRIVVDVQPGQEWYPAGDLVFYQQQVEVLRLRGVSRPETFRQTVLKTQQSHLGVQQAQRRVAAPE